MYSVCVDGSNDIPVHTAAPPCRYDLPGHEPKFGSPGCGTVCQSHLRAPLPASNALMSPTFPKSPPAVPTTTSLPYTYDGIEYQLFDVSRQPTTFHTSLPVFASSAIT